MITGEFKQFPIAGETVWSSNILPESNGFFMSDYLVSIDASIDGINALYYCSIIDKSLFRIDPVTGNTIWKKTFTNAVNSMHALKSKVAVSTDYSGQNFGAIYGYTLTGGSSFFRSFDTWVYSGFVTGVWNCDDTIDGDMYVGTSGALRRHDVNGDFKYHIVVNGGAKEVYVDLEDDSVYFSNYNSLYKIQDIGDQFIVIWSRLTLASQTGQSTFIPYDKDRLLCCFSSSVNDGNVYEIDKITGENIAIIPNRTSGTPIIRLLKLKNHQDLIYGFINTDPPSVYNYTYTDPAHIGLTRKINPAYLMGNVFDVEDTELSYIYATEKGTLHKYYRY